MIATAPMIQSLADCRDTSLVGGKAVNLGVLIRAGFTVPGGFVITTAAYRQRAVAGDGIPADLAGEIVQSWRAMGAPPVAVRSSATAEDMSGASMAGQYETYLDIRDEQTLLDRVRACWASIDSPRTRSYLKEHGIELSQVAMAVVVQELVHAEVAGVLFTANPQTGSRGEMLIEASWGLGEAVVSGSVQPDVLRIDRATGRVVQATIADKRVMIPPGSHEPLAVPDDRRQAPCLKSADVAALWSLGLKASAHFGSPQDIEWAIADSRLYLLQSRPITTLEEAETYEQCLQSTRFHLRQLLDKGRGPWVVHNISETLPHPTPLTWSVIRRFMSGSGGFGAMYRQAGFEPSPLVCREGFLELIAGRVYMDAALCPEMFFENFPFRYDVEELRRNPDAAQSPPTIPFGPVRARMRMARKAAHASAVVAQLADNLDVQLNGQILPAFTRWADEQKSIDLQSLSTQELVDLWRGRERRVMDEFAPQSLLPSLIAGAAMAELKTCLEECLWEHDADELTHLLCSGHEADMTVQANVHLYAVAEGRLSIDQWLSDYGHRAPEEFDLAAPRWRDRREDLQAMAQRLRGGADPAELHGQHLAKVRARIEELHARLPAADSEELDRRLSIAQRYMRFREDGKYYLMLGFDLLRDLALEAGRRLEIGDDIFMLTLEEMIDALQVGYAPHSLITQRRIQRKAQKRITLPYVIDATNLDEIGAPARLSADGAMRAFAISPGVAGGPARIVRSPESAGELGRGYVLVCPSTDPSWTPLFTNAAGLILECGGTLSHGAVVAREMSIPAVVLRDACTLLREGESITIDGRNGLVTRSSNGHPAGAPGAPAAAAPHPVADANDTHIPREQLPPPPGRRDRSIGRIRNLVAAVWGVYLLLAMLLPEHVLYQPSMHLLDLVLWPLVQISGKAGMVAIVAAALGAATMILQRLLTNNARLRLARQRAAALARQASALPPDSPRAQALRRAAAPVQGRILGAAMVPLALILGPMVMVFLWLPARVNPDAWNARPGTAVTIVAMVRSGAAPALTLEMPPDLQLDSSTPAAQDVMNVHQELDDWKKENLKPTDLSSFPWEVREAATRYRQEQLAELDSFLQNVPPVAVQWTIHSPARVSNRWPIRVRAGTVQALDAAIVLGDRHAPEVTEVTSPAGPIVSLNVKYQSPDEKQPNLAASLSFVRPDWQWLLLYLLVYIPVMFGFKIALKVA